MDRNNLNLNQHEEVKEADNANGDVPIQPASLRQMYRYVTGKYWIMLTISIMNAFIAGVTNPARLVLVRDTFNEVCETCSLKDTADGIREQIVWFGVVAGIGGVCCYIFCMIFMVIGAKISYELKWRYFKAVLSQDCAWYEGQNIEELPTQINVNVTEVENATGKTTGFIIYCIGALIGGIGCSFFIGMLLACAYLVIIPYILTCGISRGKLLMKGNEEFEKAYEKSGADAEQALMSIRVVKAFNQESAEVKKYLDHLSQANKSNHKYSLLFGFSCGLVESAMFFIIAYSLMIGGFFIAADISNSNVERGYNMGDILGSYMSVLIGAMFIGASAMNAQTLRRGLDCAGNVLAVIDRKPPIDIYDQDVEELKDITEDIEFKNVTFKYKGRNKIILDNVSLTFKKGKTTALVGPSGCGKSTIIRLLERFYDPVEGQVLVNSKNLKNLQLQQYRRKIGYVGQEPCLLNETIKENLLNGNPNATDADIINALKQAQAYDFVIKLPKGIETEVGGVGSKLSGGQKQRIAIARALLKNPDLLILDEATSALDTENERAVQTALDNINKIHSITTVVIAHRLTTIKNADFIYVLNNGKVVETGNHRSLIEKDGLYSSYFKSQEKANEIHDSKLHKKHDEDDEDRKTDDERRSLLGDRNDAAKQEQTSFQIFKKLYPYNNPKFLIIVLLVGCAVVAVGMPLVAIYVVKCLFSYNGHDGSYMREKLAIYCPVIAGFGMIIFVAQTITRYSLQILSLSMTNSIRRELYQSLINQPINFYDKKDNSTGNLTGILATDSRVVNGASIELYVLLYQGAIGMIAGVIIGFIQEWNLGLVIFGLLPATAFCTYFQTVVQTTPPPKASKYGNVERTIISDSISNYSTMLTLAHQEKYVDKYYSCEEGNNKKSSLRIDMWQIHWFSLAYAASNALINGYVIPMLYVMASNIENGHNIRAQFIGFMAGLFGSLSLSIAMFNSPDFTKGKESAIKVFSMIESPQEGDYRSSVTNGTKNISPEEASGDIEFHNIWFKYPSSKDWVLKNFTFKIKGNESVGFVGESGCGKSTVTLLLLRFYEPNKGFITIGGTKITEFTIKSLREALGLVQQEPIVFNCSVMENLCYGKPNATAEEIRRAAELANASDFIDGLAREEVNGKPHDIAPKESDPRYSQLSDGYRIICGHKGSKLSGGQKQRLAIARSLIRNPRIMLLDEATSALDERTQVEVQKTLDKIMEKTTSIVIAHRNSTLSECDRIVQIYDGVIMEESKFKN